jgi:hypothetical protein
MSGRALSRNGRDKVGWDARSEGCLRGQRSSVVVSIVLNCRRRESQVTFQPDAGVRIFIFCIRVGLGVAFAGFQFVAILVVSLWIAV